MLKLLGFLTVIILITGCSFPGVYKIDVPQGNIITQEMIDQLKPGMTQRQVRYIMGSPMIVDTFNPNRWDYLYHVTFGKQAPVRKHIALFFENDQLSHFVGDFIPSQAKSQASTPSP